jgi:hypothetical protein
MAARNSELERPWSAGRELRESLFLLAMAASTVSAIAGIGLLVVRLWS